MLLAQVDQRLQTKVYLVGLSVSLADLVIFATLYRALVSYSNNNKFVLWLHPSISLTNCLPVGKHSQCANH